MHSGLIGMGTLFMIVLFVGIGGVIILPGGWKVGFASVAGLSFLGLATTGYAVAKQEGKVASEIF